MNSSLGLINVCQLFESSNLNDLTDKEKNDACLEYAWFKTVMCLYLKFVFDLWTLNNDLSKVNLKEQWIFFYLDWNMISQAMDIADRKGIMHGADLLYPEIAVETTCLGLKEFMKNTCAPEKTSTRYSTRPLSLKLFKIITDDIMPDNFDDSILDRCKVIKSKTRYRCEIGPELQNPRGSQSESQVAHTAQRIKRVDEKEFDDMLPPPASMSFPGTSTDSTDTLRANPNVSPDVQQVLDEHSYSYIEITDHGNETSKSDTQPAHPTQGTEWMDEIKIDDLVPLASVSFPGTSADSFSTLQPNPNVSTGVQQIFDNELEIDDSLTLESMLFPGTSTNSTCTLQPNPNVSPDI